MAAAVIAFSLYRGRFRLFWGWWLRLQEPMDMLLPNSHRLDTMEAEANMCHLEWEIGFVTSKKLFPQPVCQVTYHFTSDVTREWEGCLFAALNFPPYQYADLVTRSIVKHRFRSPSETRSANVFGHRPGVSSLALISR